ncbi:MAG TPA: DNA topoisomerase IB [Vicinamibacteria bacterium]|nr:DNA topoisomerase IB [Vicinamibacteria bacterium]
MARAERRHERRGRPRRSSRSARYLGALRLAAHAGRAARAAGLRHVDDEAPGVRRRKHGRGLSYVGPAGPVRDRDTIARIRSLAVPPAWTDVWICPDPLGHVQATGRDARGRKQYRYHPRWRTVRDEAKYGRMLAFGQVLPAIRERAARDLDRPGLRRPKVVAAVVRLLETTLIRVGNEEYARDNGSFGLTTLRRRHVAVEGDAIRFRFKGKSGKTHDVAVEDRRLALVVRRCLDRPGPVVFRYLDGHGRLRPLDSSDVNAYLREITGQEFTAKDFRTWAGTVLAAWALREVEGVATRAEAKRQVVRAVERVARRLGNTVAICRKSYVHPVVIDSYLEGSLAATLQRRLEDEMRAGEDHLQPEEMAVLALLHRRLRQASKVSRPPTARSTTVTSERVR